MSLSHSPYVVTTGLVFAYDQNNIRSYKGPPVQNLANNISMANYAATGITATPSTQVEQIPGVGLATTYRSTIQNNYTAFTPNSADCCPALHNWGNFAVTPSTLYTYLILYKCDSEYTNSNYMYRYEYASNGGAYVTEGGVHNTTNRVNLGGGWYYAWGTFTTQATTNWLGTCASFYYRYSNVADRLTVAKVAIIAGNYSGLHPKYWPNQASTRTNTQSILDFTNNNAVTATSLTYASDGTFSFNGSTNHIISTNNGMSHGTSDFTYSCWAKFAGLPGLGTIFENGFYTNGILIRFETNVIRIYAQYSTTTYTNAFSFTPTLGLWYNLIVTRVGNNLLLYSNGVLLSTIAFGTSINVVPSNNLMFIGMSQHQAGQCFNGQIANAQVYNRALSAEEVNRNFQALRGRFGL